MTIDRHDAYPRTIRGVLCWTVVHRRSRYLSNRLEQDHRGIKQRYYPMRGFGSLEAASRFCTAHDELRNHLRPRRTTGEAMSLAERRRLFRYPWAALRTLMTA